MYPPRIVVSPKALALANHLLNADLNAGYFGVGSGIPGDQVLSTEPACLRLNLAPDTLYRALIELRELGALTSFSREGDGVRHVNTNPGHWLFVAIEQGLQVSA